MAPKMTKRELKAAAQEKLLNDHLYEAKVTLRWLSPLDMTSAHNELADFITRFAPLQHYVTIKRVKLP